MAKLEQGGFNVLPAFGRDQVVIEKYLLNQSRKSRVDLVLAFSLKFHSTLNLWIDTMERIKTWGNS